MPGRCRCWAAAWGWLRQLFCLQTAWNPENRVRAAGCDEAGENEVNYDIAEMLIS